MDTSKYVTIDLREVKYQLEDSGLHESELTDGCPACGETVKQSTLYCLGCGIPVIWLYSKAWRLRYGSADNMMRLYQNLTPETRLEREIARLFGFKGLFSSKTQRDQARGIIRAQGEPWIWESLKFKYQVRGLPFQSWLTHARNNKPASLGRPGHEEDEHETVEHEEELPW